MFARVTTFQGTPDVVDGAIRFPVEKASRGITDLPGFLGMFDLADRESGRSMLVTLWATAEARAATEAFAQRAIASVCEESSEQVVSVERFEVGYHILGDDLVALLNRSQEPE